ncbi:MAG TPA: phosphotransferase [Kineosporiaceae bacterium]|nr:phosphotransferase [Kineosporiaceae bacterium]
MRSEGVRVVRSRTAAALTDHDLEKILDAVPVTAAHPRTVHRLPGGLTNVNLKVTGPAGSMVTRVSTVDSALLAIDVDMFAVQAEYPRVVREHGFRLPEGHLDYLPRFAQVREALAAHPEPTVPCHDDLLAENFIGDGRRLRLIDDEYAGNNDPCFELGNIWSESSLAVGQLEELVTHSCGRSRPRAVARCPLFGLASKYGWTLWTVIRSAAGTLDFDFWSWGTVKYERARAEFDGPDFDRLLGQARAPD